MTSRSNRPVNLEKMSQLRSKGRMRHRRWQWVRKEPEREGWRGEEWRREKCSREGKGADREGAVEHGEKQVQERKA
jgi:hypothetical protein